MRIDSEMVIKRGVNFSKMNRPSDDTRSGAIGRADHLTRSESAAGD